MKFVTVLAWIFGVGSSLLLVLSAWLTVSYENSMEKNLDAIRGYQKSYPLFWPLMIAIVCWAWIIAG